MRKVILSLIKKYFSLGLFNWNTVTVVDKGGVKTSKRFLDRSAAMWGYKDSSGNYADLLVKPSIKDEKEIIAEQVFQFTKNIIAGKSYETEEYEYKDLGTVTSKDQKMSWCIRNLIKMDILTPWDRVDMLEITDEEGDHIGMQQLPRDKDDEVEE